VKINMAAFCGRDADVARIVALTVGC
jgi:hypothetical protein